jgi:hypothetical protein
MKNKELKIEIEASQTLVGAVEGRVHWRGKDWQLLFPLAH